jgi:hypothetical protein
MVKITWLGDEDPECTILTWHGVTFIKGASVVISDERIISKAKGNRFFKTEEAKHGETKEQKGEEQKEEEPPSIIAQAFSPHKDEAYKPVKKAVRKRAAAAKDPAGLAARTTSDA